MTLDLVLLTVICVLNLFLGNLVLVRNRRAQYSVYFFLMTVFFTGWTISNYLTNAPISLPMNDLFNRLSYLMAFLSLAFAALFTYEFPMKRRISEAEKNLFWVVVTVTSILSVTSLIAGQVSYTNGGELAFTVGPWISAYGIGFILLLAVIGRNLTYSLRNARRVERSQAMLILLGFSVTAVVGFVLNVVVPTVAQDWQSTRYGPVLSLALVGSVSYAIIKHRMFDIRAVVARSVGYLAALVVLSAIYGFVVFALAQYLFDLSIPLGAEIFFACATAFISLAFQPLKQWFDKATTRIFYQDAYDPQVLFDDLNKVLVSTLDTKVLMAQSARVIATYLKPEFCVIGLKNSDGNGHRIFGETKQTFSDKDISRLRTLTTRIHRNVIIVDALETNQHELKQILQRNNIAILVRLVQNVRKSEEGFGYVALGIKKSGGEYSVQDVRTLENIANELIIAIQNALHYEEIQRFNALLQDRINEATRKLRHSNDKLKALDEAKDDFVSMASHQLRTPLTSVKGYISMVLEGDAGKINPTQRKLLEQAFSSSQRMVYLIADLLNVSRLKTGKFEIETAPVNLAEVVEQEIGQLKDTAGSRSLELTYDKPGDFPSLMLDETKTRQVIMNFVDNAIYYTPAGGKIAVKLKETPSSVELRVEDTGIGVPKSERPHLFTKFYRAANARTARPDGTGLGLFMAKKVVMSQGGSIIFETEEGKGSTFGFVFPKSSLAVDANQA